MPTYRRPELSGQGSPVPARNLVHYTESFIDIAYGYVVPKVERFIAERGMTRKDFAKHVGIQPARISRVLNAPDNWTLRTIAKLLIGAEHDPRKMIAGLGATGVTPAAEIDPRDADTWSDDSGTFSWPEPDPAHVH